MKELLRKIFKRRGPLNLNKIKRQLNNPPKMKIKTLELGITIEDFKGIKIYHINHHTDKHLIYLHGGGYIHGLNHLHFRLCRALSKKLSLNISLIDYPLLPDSTGLESSQIVYDYIKKMNRPYYLMGDSAGGGLALALFEYGIQPIKTVLLSPWLDVSMSNPQIKDYIDKDYILDYDSLKLLGQQWARSTQIDNPKVSPINRTFNHADILLIGGGNELFVPDFRALKGNNVKYLEYENMFHDFALFSNMGLKEADDSFDKILSFLED